MINEDIILIKYPYDNVRAKIATAGARLAISVTRAATWTSPIKAAIHEVATAPVEKFPSRD
jgi:hypothetical protein